MFDKDRPNPTQRKIKPKKAPKAKARPAVVRPDVVMGHAKPKARPKVDTGNILESAAKPRYKKVVPLPSKAQQARRHATVTAPVLNVLEQATRPLHAIAGATDAAIAGKNVPRAALRGIQNKDKTTFSKPLRRLGVPKGIAAGAGLALDIAADPLTYATLGTGTIGRKAVAAAGKTAAGKTARRLARDVNPNIAPENVDKKTWAEATSAGRTAQAKINRGHHEAKQRAVAVRKAIGTDDKRVHDAIEADTIDELPANLQPAARHLKESYARTKAAERAAGVKGGDVTEMRPMAVPDDPAKAIAQSAKDVAKARRARASAERRHRDAQGGQAHAQGRAEVLSRNVSGRSGEQTAARSARVVALAESRAGKRATPAQVLAHIDEVERRAHRYAGGGAGVTNATRDASVSAAEVKAARKAQAQAEAAHAAALATGRSERRLRHVATEHNLLAAVAPKSYVPHYTARSLEEGSPSEMRGSVGRRTINPEFAKGRARERQRPLETLRREHPGVYNEDAALAYANRMASGSRAVAQAALNHRLAGLGRDVQHGKPIELADNEGVFKLSGSDLKEITDSAELRRLAGKVGINKGDERYVILHRDVVAHAHRIAKSAHEPSEILRKFDRVQGGFKYIATVPNPGFHLRNLVGDTQNAYLAQKGHRIAGNLVRSGKTLRALRHTEEAQRTLGATPKQVHGSVKIDGKSMSYDELAHEAAEHGAIRTGFLNRELADLQHHTEGITKVHKESVGQRVGRTVKRTIQSREDLPRLTTYVDGRRRGMSPDEAARHSAMFHFDYSNLTDFERTWARRFVPFYTFSARNIPLQAKMVLKKPGKYANYQKVREEAANLTGLGDGWENDLKPWEQHNAGIPFTFHGKKYTVSMGLPLTDLNEFPTTADPTKILDEWFQKAASLTTPLVKSPWELWANYSAFFREPIRRQNAPLVAAPSWVGSWPESMRKKLGVVKIVDKKTGKKIWGWDAKVNYVAHLVPGPHQQVSNLASGTDQAGRGTKEKLLSAAGLKTAPIDPAATKINTLYDELNRVQTKLGALSQQGIKRPTSTPERNALNLEVRRIEREMYEASRKRGDKVLPTAGRPRAARPSGGGGGLSGGLGGGLSGGL